MDPYQEYGLVPTAFQHLPQEQLGIQLLVKLTLKASTSLLSTSLACEELLTVKLCLRLIYGCTSTMLRA